MSKARGIKIDGIKKLYEENEHVPKVTFYWFQIFDSLWYC